VPDRIDNRPSFFYAARHRTVNPAMMQELTPRPPFDRLLLPEDPPPCTLVNADGGAPLVLFCDHGGRAFPAALERLGLSPRELDQHIAWDIGIAGLGRILAAGLDAPLLLANYSRLVIDCNRRLADPTSIAQESDRTRIPGNCHMTEAERKAREREIFTPYHQALDQLILRQRDRVGALAILSLHSFTPSMNGFQRPWHIGILWNRDGRLPVPLMRRLAEVPDLCVGDNEPYSGRDEHGYSIRAHAEDLGLPHALIEIRQDLIADSLGQEQWAKVLRGAIVLALGDAGLNWRAWT
jgi:predicted N-formylglutamate amidohydrolase